MTKPSKAADRARRRADEKALDAVAMRVRGLLSKDVGKIMGIPPEAVRIMTTRVLNADLAESGEGPEVVRAAYWF